MGSTRSAIRSVLLVASLVVALVATSLAAPPAGAVPEEAPANLAPDATSIANNPLFTWDPVVGVTQYRFELSTDPLFGSTVESRLVSNSAFTVFDELPPATYYWRVAAYDGGNGPWSSVAEFDKDEKSGPALVAPDDGHTFRFPDEPASLAWEPIPGARSYVVEVDEDAGFGSPSTSTVTGPAITFVDTPPFNVPQYWRVRGASGSNGNGVLTAWSPEVRSFDVEWPDVPVLTTPPDTIPLTTVTDVELEWAPVPGAYLYQLQISLNFDFSGDLEVNRTLPGTRWVPFETLDNGSYYWRVRARNRSGVYGEWSDVSAFTRGWPSTATLSAPIASQKISDLDPFSWTPVERASHYELHVGTDANFSSGTYVTCQTSHTEVSDVSGGRSAPGGCALWSNTKGVNLSPTDGTPRFWRVRGIDSPRNITGLWSATQVFDPVPRLHSPNFLAELEAPADGATVDVPVLRWAPMDSFAADGEIEEYVVTVEDKDGVVVDAATTQSTSYVPQVPLSAAASPYTWWVEPSGYVGPGAPEERTFTVSPATPGASPTPLLPAPGAADRELPALTWAPVVGADDYLVQVRPQGAATWLEPFAPTSATGYAHHEYPFVPHPGGPCALVEPSPTDPDTFNETYCASLTTVPFPPSGLFVPDTYEWRVVARDAADVPVATGAASTFEVLDFGEIAYQAPTSCTPGTCTALTASPLFDWEHDPRADDYDVYLAFDANFTNVDRTYGVTQSQFLPREELPDNDVGQAYYWHVQPCMKRPSAPSPLPKTLCSLDPEGRPAPSSAFQKRSEPVVLTFPPSGATVPADAVGVDPSSSALWDAGCTNTLLGTTWDQRCTPRFEWQDYQTSSPDDIGVRQYRIQVSTTPLFETIIDDEFTDQTFYSPESKTYPAGPLWWRVRVRDISGNDLTWSESRPLTYRPPAPNPASPTPGQSISGVPSFQWEEQAFAAEYRFELYKDADLNASPANRVLRVNTQHTELTPYSSLPLGTYAWRVQSRYGDNAYGPWSATRLVTLTAEAPTLAQPIDDAVLDGERLVFSWSGVEGAARYRFQLSDSPTFASNRENELTVMQSIATRRSVPNGVWYWRVIAVDGENNDLGVSETRMFTRDLRDLPSAPRNLSVVNGPGEVRVSWSPPEEPGDPAFTQYVVELSGPDGLGGTDDRRVVTSSGLRTVTFKGVLNGSTAQVTVAAQSADGVGDPATVNALPNGCAGTPFADVGSFCNEIAWLYTQSITNGTTLPDGTRLYKPVDAVSRQAMAAFLHRYDGDTPPANLATPYFADVGPTHPFYADIQWMYEEGISTGTPQPFGKPLYKPADPVSRQAMAAFLHRFEGGTPDPLDRPFFADVPEGAAFYRDIQWMAWSGLSTGTAQPVGKPLYKPVDPVSRQAMAAFLFRFDQL